MQCDATAASEVNLREGAGNGNRIDAGGGVGMCGVAGVVVGVGTVSPVHRVIIGERAVGRDGDGLVGLGGAPGGDERIRVSDRGRGQDVVPAEAGGGGEPDVGVVGGRADPDGHSDIGVLYTIHQAGDCACISKLVGVEHTLLEPARRIRLPDLNQVRLYRMPAPLCYQIPRHRDTAVSGDRAHIGRCGWWPGLNREHELFGGIKGGGIAVASGDGNGRQRLLSKCGS